MLIDKWGRYDVEIPLIEIEGIDCRLVFVLQVTKHIEIRVTSYLISPFVGIIVPIVRLRYSKNDCRILPLRPGLNIGGGFHFDLFAIFRLEVVRRPFITDCIVHVDTQCARNDVFGEYSALCIAHQRRSGPAPEIKNGVWGGIAATDQLFLAGEANRFDSRVDEGLIHKCTR